MIRIRGAREHNLRGIDLDLPTQKLIAFTGVSGSGKSSLAFHTLYAEANRRFVEALTPDLRARLGQLQRPEVDSIEGLPPAIGVSQRGTQRADRRASVASEAMLADLLAVLWAGAGTPGCPQCGVPHRPADARAITAELVGTGRRLQVLAPVVRRGPVRPLLRELPGQGYARVRLDGVVVSIDEAEADDREPHDLDVVIDRLAAPNAEDEERKARLREALGGAIALSVGAGRGEVIVLADDEVLRWGVQGRCGQCGAGIGALSRRVFSRASPRHACGACEGTGTVREVNAARLVDPEVSVAQGAVDGGKALRSAAEAAGVPVDRPWKALSWEHRDFVLNGGTGWEGAVRRVQRLPAERLTERLLRAVRDAECHVCSGSGLGALARATQLCGQRYSTLGATPLSQLSFPDLPNYTPLIAEVRRRLDLLVRLGLGHLNLQRRADTLSSSESQRLRLAAAAGNQLSGILYVLDEPTAGLHAGEVQNLVAVLRDLVALGNTVIVVEHDPTVIMAADYVVEIGPGPGQDGGSVVYAGPSLPATTPTGAWLARMSEPPLPRPVTRVLRIVRPTGRNLSLSEAVFPVGALTAVCGPSGSGKTTLVFDTLGAAVAQHLGAYRTPEPAEAIEGLSAIGRLILSGPTLSRADRSLVVSGIRAWTPLRALYAGTAAARQRGWGPEHWSLHLPGGRCGGCEGEGRQRVDLLYLPGLSVPCERCEGGRYDDETAGISVLGLSMPEALNLRIADAATLYGRHPAIGGPLRTLVELGLGYLSLGQPLSTLSGGEHQRVALARELGQPSEVARTLYLLREPSVGLHPADLVRLSSTLHRLADLGATLVAVDSDPHFCAGADAVITL